MWHGSTGSVTQSLQGSQRLTQVKLHRTPQRPSLDGRNGKSVPKSSNEEFSTCESTRKRIKEYAGPLSFEVLQFLVVMDIVFFPVYSWLSLLACWTPLMQSTDRCNIKGSVTLQNMLPVFNNSFYKRDVYLIEGILM